MAERSGAKPPAQRMGAAAEREDRFEAMIEERLRPEHRGAMARQLADHDRRQGADPAAAREARPAPGVRMAPGGVPVRCFGEVPEKVRALLTRWVPELIAHAAGHGLAVRDLSLEVLAYGGAAYEQAHGKLDPRLKLPASSYRFQPVYKLYSIHLVLPERLEGSDEWLAALRAFLGRLFGDIYLREEVFSREAYREDVNPAQEEVTVGMAEKLLLLEESAHSSPELDAALAAHGTSIGMSAQRQPGPVRKAFLRSLRQALEAGPLPPAQEAALDGAFARYLAALRRDLPKAVAEMIAATEALDTQVSLLPPHEWPDYLKLKQANPAHYLRSAKLRLQQVLDGMGAVQELADALEQDPAALTPLEEERVHGHLAELEAQRLARPYLLKGVRLSPEMERRKEAFPLEVHALLTRLPPAADPGKRFRALSQRIENSVHQRLYHAFVLLRQGLRMRERGRSFVASPHFPALKAVAANFRHRRPLLEAHFARLGVVLDLAEAAERQAEAGRERFPVQPFTRAWGQFASHALLAEFLAARGQAGFDPDRYWRAVEAQMKKQLAQDAPAPRLAYLLRRIQARQGPRGLSSLAALLRDPSGTFRFTMRQAANASPQEALEHTERWAEAVLRVREARLRNAILPGAGE